MPRVTEITLPSDQTATLLDRIRDIPQVISIRLEKGISVQPQGDVVTVAVTDRSLPQLMRLLDQLNLTHNPASSITTNRPMGMISQASAQSVRNDASQVIWEEMDQELNKASGMTPSSIISMAIAGVIATVGLMTNTLHLVIGAMVIAPGFEPISRLVFGIVARSQSWRRGFADCLKAYASLIAGAMAATILLKQWGYTPAATQATYLPAGALLSYWTSISGTSLLVSAVAATAGALLIIGQRAVLTAGVMIALALIPAATMLGMGIASADMRLATTGLSRLAGETLLVVAMSALVFAWKRNWIDKRKMST